MIDKSQARKRLGVFYAWSHIDGFLSKFPDTHTWREEDLHEEFINYINSLPPIPKHEDE
jgi:hypothetical protein